MDRSLKILKDKYNSISLSSADPKIQQEIKQKIKEGIVINPTVTHLLQNHFYKKKPVAKKISGPLSLSAHYSKKYGKIIYVFGEMHGKENPCCTIGNPFNK